MNNDTDFKLFGGFKVMEKWQDVKEFFLLPLNWHGNDEGQEDDVSDTSTDTDDDKDGDAAGTSAKIKSKKNIKTDKSTKSKNIVDDADDVTDDLPEDLDGLSAQELRELLKLQGKELKKTRTMARERLHEIMEKKEKFKEIEAKQEAARLKELEEKEEYKKLYEEIKPKFDVLAKDVSKTHTFFEKRLIKLTEDLPEEYHGLVPDVDVRSKIAWIENFKATVLSKKIDSGGVEDTPKIQPKKKAETTVGNSGNPPEDPDKNKEDDKSTIEAAIHNCTSPEDLERLVTGLSKKGL